MALPSRADDTDGADLHLSLGPGLYTIPCRPGASSSQTHLFPFIDAEYENRYYTSISDLFGIYGIKTQDTQAGAAIVLDPTGRNTHHDARLHHLPGIRDTARLKLFASHTVLFITVDGNLASDMLGHGQGTLAQANIWLTAPLSRDLAVNIGPGATWADTRYMDSFFAVTPQQAAAADLPSAHSTHAGLLDTHLNVLIEWQFQSHYRIGLLGYLARLSPDVAASPIVERRAQRTLVGWVAYRFR